ncbi:2OG-Fe(II) oxygenase [Terricaulis sp.]|uniref:2OG-Fe(II) oxygenase n=1 Tax=Terricaulis sp. TaxID=2768686 RepID=UPI003785058C
MADLISLNLAASSGDPRAQFQLARLLLVGREARYNPEQAMRWVNAACAQKYPQALLFHATLAALGFGRPQSFSDAIGLVAEAAATGDARAQGQLAALGGVEGYDPKAWFAPVEMIQRQTAPRAYTVPNFLSKPACAWLASEASKNLQAARVKDPDRGGSAVDKIRTNTGTGFSIIESDLVLQMTRMKIANTIQLPLAQLEPTNILHYEKGQEYKAHFDFITEQEAHGFQSELARIGQRICTFLIYLNDDYEGGETDFLRLDWRFKGKTGDALIFWNMSADGVLERDSLHAGTPVTRGEKWLFSQWVREKPFPVV